jgi:type VI secretion system protein ImpF
MARFENEVEITASVLDRLVDSRPDQSQEGRPSRQTSLRVFKNAVKRDLEWLLNTRADTDVPTDLEQVARSLATYGLPDLSSWNVKSPDERHGLQQAVEDALRRFEPRLEAVQVTLQAVSDTDRSVRFRIDARLRVDPAPEPVTFDSVLQLGNNQFSVKGE